jgi:hypothetical protein
LASRTRPAKDHVLDVLATAGTAVFAFRIDDEQEIIPFRISSRITGKEGKSLRLFFAACEQGVFRLAG